MSPTPLAEFVQSAQQPRVSSIIELNDSSAHHGMQCIDTTGNPRIPLLMEMVGALSRADQPQEVLNVFSEAYAALYGPRGTITLSTRGLKPGEYRITRLFAPLAGHHAFTNGLDPWNNASKLPIHTGGFLGELIRKAYPELIQFLDVPNDPVLGSTLAPYRSLMAIPLFDNGEPLNWAFFLHPDPTAFGVKELEQEILRGNLIGGAVKNTIIRNELRDAHVKISREIQQIARIQRALLPQNLPHIPGLSIATSYETFDTAGGDLYDLRQLAEPHDSTPLPTDPLAMVIADAAGHGPAAAVVTAMLNAILYAYPGGRSQPPGHVLEYANRHLSLKQLEGTFVTAFLAQFDPVTRILTYARAGHNPPLIKGDGYGAAVRRIDDIGGIPLGVLDDVKYETASITLEPGETIVLYTDGITEAMNPKGEMFGVSGIERALHECSGEPACVVNSINTELRAHEAGVRPSDDQTIVAVKIEN